MQATARWEDLLRTGADFPTFFIKKSGIHRCEHGALPVIMPRGNPGWSPQRSQRAGGRRGDPDLAALAVDPVSGRLYAELLEEARAARRISLNERNAEVLRGKAQAARANELSTELVELKRKMASEIILRTGTGNTQINEHGKTLFEYLLPWFAPKSVVGVVMAALGHFHRDKENETDILKEVRKWPFLRNLLNKYKEEVIEERDKQIYDHLTTNVFNPRKATLLRNTPGHSMRTSNYMQNTWKFNRMVDCTKVQPARARLQAVGAGADQHAQHPRGRGHQRRGPPV